MKLKCGRVLSLQAVNPATLSYIITELQGHDITDAENWPTEKAEQFNEAVERLFNYCAGWGVVDSPTEDDLMELVALKFVENPVAHPNVARVAWLRYMLLKDKEEAGALIGYVMALTLGGEGDSGDAG